MGLGELDVKNLAIAMGLSALLAAPATAATLYEATASATISGLRADPGLTVTYTSTTTSNAFATGALGASAGAGLASVFLPPGPDAFTRTSVLTFGADAKGVTPPNPNLNTAVSSSLEQAVTLTFVNTTSASMTAGFDIAYSLFAEAQSDGLPGETSFARMIVTFALNGQNVFQQFLTRERKPGESGTDSFTFVEPPFTQNITVAGATTDTFTFSLRAEGNAAAAAVTPIPLPGSAPLFAAALLGAGALLRRRRAA